MKMRIRLLALLLFVLPGVLKAQDTLFVALDGSGDFSTISAAVESCRAFMEQEKVIFIKNGIYNEKVEIPSWLMHITLEGESADSTRVVWNDYAGLDHMGTFRTWTMKVAGDYITLKNLSIENNAGPVGQAVALHVEGDHFAALSCHLKGMQDTLFASGLRSHQLYKRCLIEGTTDFIFGPATALFDSCTILSLKDSYITAASTPRENPYGFVFLNCRLTAAGGVSKVYLGRPWRDYAQVVFISCELGKHIRPEGWHNWSRPETEKTAFFAEAGNTGPGAMLSERVPWSRKLSKDDVSRYTCEKILDFR